MTDFQTYVPRQDKKEALYIRWDSGDYETVISAMNILNPIKFEVNCDAVTAWGAVTDEASPIRQDITIVRGTYLIRHGHKGTYSYTFEPRGAFREKYEPDSP